MGPLGVFRGIRWTSRLHAYCNSSGVSMTATFDHDYDFLLWTQLHLPCTIVTSLLRPVLCFFCGHD
ncbi:hypothetical protein L873DRAFT_1805246 [Choiromyces venosus 120613-1]|uniref:Uncharacterized protein n=1 Tax=Choiromyces venosus 120613-1 TaxID=1336337 RepID=A0A3N4JQ08_9PEZI|nr:hypothetical protein L873DRAFT_1805246 [Choiromyces venosus 120613-1]